jgi:hypothetical protein
MTGLVRRWRAGVAVVAIYALTLQALLHSIAPLAHAGPDQYDSLSLVLCPQSSHLPSQDKAPGVPADRPDTACCTLCLAAGLDVANDGISVAKPDYQSSGSSLLTARVAAGLVAATELSPIKPRAPPRFS